MEPVACTSCSQYLVHPHDIDLTVYPGSQVNIMSDIYLRGRRCVFLSVSLRG